MISSFVRRVFPFALLTILGACAASPPPVAPTAEVALPVASSAAPPASAPASAPASEPAPSAAPEKVTGKETAFAAGKWPEGAVLAHGTLWVAESGSRRVLRLDPRTGDVKAKIPVGRLPVEMFIGHDGALYTVAATDRALYRIDPKSNTAKVVKTFPDYAEHASFVDGAYYALLLNGGSSLSSTVVRFATPGAPLVSSKPIGLNASAIIVAHGRVFVPQSTGIVTVLDATTLALMTTFDVGGHPFRGAASKDALFLGDHGRILRVDPTSLAVTCSVPVPALPTALLVEDDTLLAMFPHGEALVLDTATLATRKTLPLTNDAPHVGSLFNDGKTLYFTRFDEAGAEPVGHIVRFERD